MPLRSYGVLKARAVDRRREGAPDDSPHYQVHLVDDDGTDYRIAVNVLSQLPPSELLYLAVDDFRHPITALLPEAAGWTALPPRPGGANLDFIRANLFDPAAMRPLPPDVSGPDNDLADRLDHYIERAIADPQANVYAFGERWGPESNTSDKIFGFRPGNGVHDIHMNQGNSGRFRADDGVWQDGGLLLHFPGEGRWVAIFLAFQSQAWHTDDRTGHAIEGAPPRPTPTPPPPTPAPPEPVPMPPEPVPSAVPLRIVAALVNPVGPAPEAETATLLNVSASSVDLTGWRLADRMKRSCPLPEVDLAPGATLLVQLPPEVQLGNKGGAITLLDPDGLKVDGVAYTGDAIPDEGWTVVF
jgi:uncharacterized protein YukJ